MQRKKARFLALVTTVILVISVVSIASSGLVLAEKEDKESQELSQIEINKGSIQNEAIGEEPHTLLNEQEQTGEEERISTNYNPGDDYAERPPFRIDNNTEFDDMADDERWPGNGTADDPYIIEGFEIDGGDFGSGIFIGNVTRDFIIRENYIHNITGRVFDEWFDNTGVYLYNTTGGIIENNTILESDTGEAIQLEDAHRITVKDNELSNEHSAGVLMWGSTDNVIDNNIVSDNNRGIYLREGSSGNQVTNNSVSYASICAGIRVRDWSSGNTIFNNTIYENRWGIRVEDESYENTIIQNNVTSNGNLGIYLRPDSDENVIQNNSLTDNNIHVMRSIDVVIQNNTLVDGSGIRLVGGEKEQWNTHVIDTTNTVDGDPVYYIKNQEGETVPSDAGQVILANSTDMTVDNLEITGINVGVLLGFSHDNIIRDNDLTDNGNGILLSYSDGNTITNNDVSNGGTAIGIYDSETNIVENNYMENSATYGVYISGGADNTVQYNEIYSSNTYGLMSLDSTDNTIRQNEIIDGDVYGIYIFWGTNHKIQGNTVSGYDMIGIYNFFMSHEHLIQNNTIIDNEVGLELNMAEDNEIYHNSFIDNEVHAVGTGDNDWGKGYPAGGNYWSDYYAEDNYHGEDQDVPGSDGIGDMPYEGDGFTDDYPLMQPSPTPHARIDYPNDHPDEDIYVAEEEIEVELTGMYRFTDTLYYEVRLNDGEWIDLGTDTSYTFDDVEDGEHTVEVRVSDGEGNIGLNNADFILDTEPPVLDITSPTDEALFKEDQMSFSWSGYDNTSGIDHYEVRLNEGEWIDVGKAMSHTFTGLPDGEHLVEVRAWDEAGHNSTDELTFEVATEPPILEITTPEGGVEELTYEEEFVINGTTEPDAELWIDGEEVDVDDQGDFTYETTLVDGQNVFIVVAEDEAGNTASTEVYALYLPDIPEIWDEVDSLWGQIDDLQSQIDDQQEQIDDLEAEIDDLQTQIDGLEAEIDDLQAQIDELEEDLENETEDLQEQIDDLEAEIEDLRQELEELEEKIEEEDEEDDEIPGFTAILLILGAGIAVAVYHKKRLAD